MNDRGAMGGRSEGPQGDVRHAGGPGGWRARGFVFATVAALWLLLSGPLSFHHPLLLVLWPVSATIVVWLCDRLGLVTDETVPLELTWRTLAYVPWLGFQVVVSCFAVLRCVWWPGGSRLDPTTARITSSTRTDVGLVSYASSITLTPGTLSLEAEPSTGVEPPSILVHALTPAGIAELRSGGMEARVRHVEAASSALRSQSLEPGAAG